MTDSNVYELIQGSMDAIPAIPKLLHALLLGSMPPSPALGVIPIEASNPSTDRETAFAQEALENAVEQLRATDSNRNDALNGAAYRMGRIVGTGWLDQGHATNALQQAAYDNGYISKDGVKQARATILSGLRAGMKDPRVSIDGDDDQPPIPLPDALPPVAPFELRFLPDTFQPWVADASERQQGPIDYFAIGAMIAASAAIGRRIGIRPRPYDDWTVTPNLWGMIVGTPGMMKTPAISEALRPLQRLERQARQRHEKQMKAYAREMKNFKMQTAALEKEVKKGEVIDAKAFPVEPVEPKQARFIVVDTTYESLGEILVFNPFGVLVHRDEIMGLLKSLDREENAAAKAFYLSAWSGNQGYTFDRIGRGYLHIDAACISVLGTTQPGKVAEYVSRASTGGGLDDGMIQRFSLMICPAKAKPWQRVDREPDAEAFRKADAAFDRLLSQPPLQGGRKLDTNTGTTYFTFDPIAAERFIDWYGTLENRLRSGDLHPAIESHLSKYRSLIPSLALIIHLVDDHVGDVGVDALERAIAFAEYLESHARHIYGAGMRADVDGAMAIIKRIEKGDLVDGFTKRDVHKKDWRYLTQWQDVSNALDMLVEYRWLREEETRGAGKGRPTTRYYRRF